MRPRRSAVLAAFAAALLASNADAAQAPTYVVPPESLPRALGPQPVPFDHKVHAQQRIGCLDCHPGAETRERAGIPDRDRCMLCHRSIATDRPGVRQLARLPAGSKIRWARAYRVPDFVFFSHASHSAASLACATCHGPVETRAELSQEVSTSMTACMNCHAEREASNECYLCHDLGQ